MTIRTIVEESMLERKIFLELQNTINDYFGFKFKYQIRNPSGDLYVVKIQSPKRKVLGELQVSDVDGKLELERGKGMFNHLVMSETKLKKDIINKINNIK